VYKQLYLFPAIFHSFALLISIFFNLQIFSENYTKKERTDMTSLKNGFIRHPLPLQSGLLGPWIDYDRNVVSILISKHFIIHLMLSFAHLIKSSFDKLMQFSANQIMSASQFSLVIWLQPVLKRLLK